MTTVATNVSAGVSCGVTNVLWYVLSFQTSIGEGTGDVFAGARTEEGKQYPYMCRRKGSMDAAEEMLLDVNALAEGKFMGIGAFAVSDDANLLAYSTDETGYRQYTLHVKDLRSGKTLSEAIERVGSVVWANDNKTLVYSTEDAVSKRSDKLWRHAVGAEKSDLIYEEKDELFDVGAGRSLDRKMIFVVSLAKTSREYRYLPASEPAGGAEGGAAARGRPRIRRRSLQRRVLRHDQPQREELPGRYRPRRAIRPRRTGSRSSTTIRRSRSTGSRSSPTTSWCPSGEGGLTFLRVMDPKTKARTGLRPTNRTTRLASVRIPSSTRPPSSTATRRW